MILHYIANDSKTVEVTAAIADIERFLPDNPHLPDEFSVPNRLENPVRKS